MLVAVYPALYDMYFKYSSVWDLFNIKAQKVNKYEKSWMIRLKACP